jgi:hypothetical protein
VNNFDIEYLRGLDWFQTCDINDVKDTRLAMQNKSPQVVYAFENLKKEQ